MIQLRINMKIKNRYTLLNMFFWMLYGVAFGYAAYYLQGIGVPSGLIGMILAVAGVLSASLQPFFGSLSDRGITSWKQIVAALAALCSILNLLMTFLGDSQVNALAFGLMLLAVNAVVPFINGASFYYSRHNEYVNFGFSRGMGSLFYAIFAYILGIVTLRMGIAGVTAMGLVSSALLLCTCLFMPCEREKLESDASENRSSEGLIYKYPWFFIVVLGVTLLLSSHYLITNFMINIIENVGGNSSDMGTSIAISALFELPAMIFFSSIVKRFSVDALMIFAAVFFLVKSTLFLLAGSVMMIYIVQISQALSYAVVIPASVYYAEIAMNPEDKMKGQSYMGVSLTVATVVGSLAGGYIIQFFGVQASLLISMGFSFLGLIVVSLGVRMNAGSSCK